jgi:hypothetical protein
MHRRTVIRAAPDERAKFMQKIVAGREFSPALSYSRQGVEGLFQNPRKRLAAEEKGRPMVWGLVAVVTLVVVEFVWGNLREWNARRRAVKRGRTLTAKYGIPWR